MDPDYPLAQQHALDHLRRELPAHLTYHNLDHTQQCVMKAAARLGRLEGLPEPDMQLVVVAAAFHDLGFIWTVEGHELASTRVAAQVLPNFGFSDRQVERVMGAIMATRLPQSPFDLLEAVLADADLDVLGRDDFMERSLDLYQESQALGDPVSLPGWYRRQIDLLEQHAYFTASAHDLRDAGKQRNLAELWRRLRHLEPSHAS